MRHPDDFGKIKRRIADRTYDESAGLDDATLDKIIDAFRVGLPWSIGDPVLRLVPSAGPSPRRGGPVSSETGP